MKTKSIKGKSSQTIKAKLNSVLNDAYQPDRKAFHPTLAIVFMSFEQNIEASDNGDGISDSIIEKIFQPFFTTKRNRRNSIPYFYQS